MAIITAIKYICNWLKTGKEQTKMKSLFVDEIMVNLKFVNV